MPGTTKKQFPTLIVKDVFDLDGKELVTHNRVMLVIPGPPRQRYNNSRSWYVYVPCYRKIRIFYE